MLPANWNYQSLFKKGPNTEFFLVRTPYLPVFSPNAEKYGPEKTPYLDNFYIVIENQYLSESKNVAACYSAKMRAPWRIGRYTQF